MDSKILMVGDNKEDLQTAMQYIIEDSIPYAMLCAFNGERGIEIALKEIPDIIILNWEIPGINGVETLKQLKKMDKTKDIPVIISTGVKILPDNIKTAFDAGASDFIKKPIEKTEFVSRISFHLKTATFIKAIKSKERIESTLKINLLNEKIDFLQSKLDDNKALILFFYETLKSIHHKLESIDALDRKAQMEIQKIITQLKQSINSLKRNYSNYNKPRTQFVRNLLDKHANLTPQEIQLCFMLKNKLCTKDIATITFREETSVKVSRSRLRKKLNLNESDSLHNYIEKF